MSVYCMYAWYQQKPEEGMESPETRVTDGATLCVLESNPGPLEVRLVLLSTEPYIPPAPVYTHLQSRLYWKAKLFRLGSDCSVYAKSACSIPIFHTGLTKVTPTRL